MTELHYDNKRCVYYDNERCGARAVYYLHGICQTVRQRIIVPPPMIGRMDTYDTGRRWGKRGRLLR